MVAFSDRLRELRGLQNQADFANKLGIKASAYGHYETGRREPSLAIILQIVEVTGTSLDWLLGKSKAPTKKETACAYPDVKVLHSAMSDNTELYGAECKECKKKAVQIERLERIIDKLTK